MKAEYDSTPKYFRYTARLIRPFPDIDFRFIKPIRKRAAGLLRLTQGNRVLDVGCGPGGSFPFLLECVGKSGQVIGVEISEAVAANARNRIAKNGWSNVEVITAPAESVKLSGVFDGLLMFGAPDAYASAPALLNVARSVKDGGRIVIFGAKLTANMPGRLLNPLLRFAMTRLSFWSTPKLTHEPWDLLSRCVKDLEVESYFGGSMFLAAGTFCAANLESWTTGE
ncbi:MAG TPA: methyltransferase domain-containing protein [Pyrinomonadaceae bacterium]|nr:methyltransferase domain-containing protein [Pyrinomonadaceae bacterium]